MPFHYGSDDEVAVDSGENLARPTSALQVREQEPECAGIGEKALAIEPSDHVLQRRTKATGLGGGPFDEMPPKALMVDAKSALASGPFEDGGELL